MRDLCEHVCMYTTSLGCCCCWTVLFDVVAVYCFSGHRFIEISSYSSWFLSSVTTGSFCQRLCEISSMMMIEKRFHFFKLNFGTQLDQYSRFRWVFLRYRCIQMYRCMIEDIDVQMYDRGYRCIDVQMYDRGYRCIQMYVQTRNQSILDMHRLYRCVDVCF